MRRYFAAAASISRPPVMLVIFTNTRGTFARTTAVEWSLRCNMFVRLERSEKRDN